MKIKTILTLSAICHLLVLQAQEIDYKGLPQWSWQKRDSANVEADYYCTEHDAPCRIG